VTVESPADRRTKLGPRPPDRRLSEVVRSSETAEKVGSFGMRIRPV